MVVMISMLLDTVVVCRIFRDSNSDGVKGRAKGRGDGNGGGGGPGGPGPAGAGPDDGGGGGGGKFNGWKIL